MDVGWAWEEEESERPAGYQVADRGPRSGGSSGWFWSLAMQLQFTQWPCGCCWGWEWYSEAWLAGRCGSREVEACA